jgi:hypothetical protein
MIELHTNSDVLIDRKKKLRKSKISYGLDYIKYCPRSGKNQLQVVFIGTLPEWLKKAPAQALVLTRIGTNEPVKLTMLDSPSSKLPANQVVVQVDSSSITLHCDYQLTVAEPPHAVQQAQTQAQTVTPTIDPFFKSLRFKFEHHEPAQTDCKDSSTSCASSASTQVQSSVDINYLAKDYATFRQLILDRLSVTMPDWKERCPADIGIMLVEILAYAADHLSYYQDAVATEAYLGTARLRSSLRRHARQVDYRVNEGCNARVWIHLDVTDESVSINPLDLFFVSFPRAVPQESSRLSVHRLEEALKKGHGCQVFEPIVSKRLTFHSNHNSMALHDWDGALSCLPTGATEAFLINRNLDSQGEQTPDPTEQIQQPATTTSLRNEPCPHDWLKLKVGDVVMFEEIFSPWTGSKADADPKHRHPVRITHIEYGHVDQLIDGGLPLVKIQWSREDSLPFTLWISKPPKAQWVNDETNRNSGTQSMETHRLTHVLGNMLLADHGRKVRNQINLEQSWKVPSGPGMQHYPQPRVVGQLAVPDLTFASPLPKSKASAATQLQSSPRLSTPQVVLQGRQSANGSLLDHFSIHELHDPDRIAKRLFREILMEINKADDEVQPTTEPEDNIDFRINHSLADVVRILAALLRACGAKEASDRDLMLSLGKLRQVVRFALKDLWLASNDLFDADNDDPRFVVEMSDERIAHLRFGQHGFGRVPDLFDSETSAEMTACYRVGNGRVGNVAPESIQWYGTYSGHETAIGAVRNPSPAVGGTDPESAKEIRLFAPQAIRSELKRAIIPQDYDSIVMREFGKYLQAVRTSLRWTGHEMAVLVAVDPLGDCPPENLFERIQAKIASYKRLGHSVRIVPARRVVPELALKVELPEYTLRSDVKTSLHELFSSRVLSNGELGYFHPDRTSFGDGIYISHLVSAGCQYLGKRVLNIEVEKLHRPDIGPTQELEDGILRLRPQEIVRFDNNPALPRFGKLTINFVGGR